MGEIVRFPGRHHRRPSTTTRSRAAKSAKVSAESRASCAVTEESTACHHSAGIRSRCHHLRTAQSPAPLSEARASSEGQSSMTDRKEAKRNRGIGDDLGRNVLKRKAILSHDCGNLPGQNVLMPRSKRKPALKPDIDPALHVFFAQFQARTRKAREDKGLTQEHMAKMLKMGNEDPQGTYKQYETRPGSLLPHEHIESFCLITGIDPNWLFGWKPLRKTPNAH